MKISKNGTKKRKQVKRYIAALMMMLVLAGQIKNQPEQVVYAASASVRFEEMAAEAEAGQKITIYLVVRTDESLGDFKADISYDPAYLEYISGPLCISKGDGILSLSDVGAAESAEIRRYALTFEVLQSGVTKLAAAGDLCAYEYETGNTMSVSSSTYVLSIADPKSTSEDASLAVLKINTGSLSPSFEADILEYNTSIGIDTKDLLVSALANDAEASVKIIGQNDLKEGQNQVYIEVTAASGATRVYTIHVTKEGISEQIIQEEDTSDQIIQEDISSQMTQEEDKNPSEDQEILSDIGIQAYKENKDTMIVGQYRYRLPESTGNVEIPDGYEESVLLLDGITIPAYKKAGEEDLNAMLLVLENEEGNCNLYRYDRIEKTIQRVSEDVITITSQDEIEELSLKLVTLTKKYQQNVERMGLITAALTMALAGLSAGWLISSRKKKKDREWE